MRPSLGVLPQRDQRIGQAAVRVCDGDLIAQAVRCGERGAQGALRALPVSAADQEMLQHNRQLPSMRVESELDSDRDGRGQDLMLGREPGNRFGRTGETIRCGARCQRQRHGQVVSRRHQPVGYVSRV